MLQSVQGLVDLLFIMDPQNTCLVLPMYYIETNDALR